MYPFLNFYSLHTFIFHGLIVAFFSWLFMSGEVVPGYKGVWIGYLFLALFALPIYFVDGVFHVNYMFLGLRSDVGILASIWDSVVPAYGRPGFLLVMAPIMAVVCHIFYLIYLLMRKLPRRRKEDKLPAAQESETDKTEDGADAPDTAAD
jgi:Predicted integral membrane protein